MTKKIKATIILLSLVASNIAFGQLKFENLKVDTSITGFHFAADFQGTKVFTKNGASDLKTINPTAFSFTVAPGLTAIIAKEQLEMLLSLSKQNGYTITDLIKKDTVLNGNKAFYISYNEAEEKSNYRNSVFNAFVIKAETLILFTGGDLDNGKYIDKFKKTFYSIKL
jgi:hypothetical protein